MGKQYVHPSHWEEEKIGTITKLSIKEEVWRPVFGTLSLEELDLSWGKKEKPQLASFF